MRWALGWLLVVAPIAGGQTLDDARRLHEEARAAYGRGDLDDAEAKFGEALAIRDRHQHASTELIASLNGLVSCAKLDGDLEAAEAKRREAVELLERAGGSAERAAVLTRLGRATPTSRPVLPPRRRTGAHWGALDRA